MSRRSVLLAAACLIAAGGCGGDGATTTSTSAPATTTTVTTTPTTSTTSTVPVVVTPPPGLDLSAGVLQDKDPWPEPVVRPRFRAYDEGNMPEGFAEAGVEEGVSSFFPWGAEGEPGRVLVTAAFRFGSDDGAKEGMLAAGRAFRIPYSLARRGNLESEAVDTIWPLEVPPLGDATTGLRGTGPVYEVLVVLWRSGNLLQWAYASMPRDDEAHAAALVDLAVVLAERLLAG
jgi:hypothetical protein